MIDRSEILGVANDLSLTPDVIEKDYVLSWLLPANARQATSSYLLRQPDLDWADLNMWRFAAAGAALGFVLACAIVAP